jgi:CheY-like chemotaxis protein
MLNSNSPAATGEKLGPVYFGEKAARPNPAIALIDDNPEFLVLMSYFAQKNNINLTTYESLADMYSFTNLRNFDLILIDYYLEAFTGVEVAEYVETFFQGIPVVLVSSESLKHTPDWPSVIKGHLEKKLGPAKIIANSLKILDRYHFYETLREKTFRNAGVQYT